MEHFLVTTECKLKSKHFIMKIVVITIEVNAIVITIVNHSIRIIIIESK